MCFSIQVDRDLNKLSAMFRASLSHSSYENYEKIKAISDITEIKNTLGLTRKPRGNPFKDPGHFTNVLTVRDSERVFQPMRFRVRPKGSKEEIPSKYNVFNARLDSLEKRKTWKSIFMKNHGLLPFVRFFEWVESDGKKQLISFKPESCLLYTSPSPRDRQKSRMPSSA